MNNSAGPDHAKRDPSPYLHRRPWADLTEKQVKPLRIAQSSKTPLEDTPQGHPSKTGLHDSPSAPRRPNTRAGRAGAQKDQRPLAFAGALVSFRRATACATSPAHGVKPIDQRRRRPARPASPTSASTPGAGTATLRLSKVGYTAVVPPGSGWAEMVIEVIAAPVE